MQQVIFKVRLATQALTLPAILGIATLENHTPVAGQNNL